MRYDLSLAGDTFSPVVQEFDRKLMRVLACMRKQGTSEGSVTLRLAIELDKQFPIDEDGQEHEIYVPRFAHEVGAQITQKEKAKGEIAEDFVLTMEGGVPRLVSRDSETLFDLVEQAEATAQERGEDDAGGGV